MDRREAIAILAATGGSAVLPRLRRWMAAGIAPGIQLYTVRASLARDPAGTLEALARIGYREVELAGLHGMAPEAMRALLDRYELSVPAAHIGLSELRDDAARMFAEAHVLGARYVVVPWLDAAERSTAAGYRRLAGELNAIARRASDAGLRLAYHNHDFELKPLDGVVPYDVLLEECDPDLVAMELDLFWIAKGGGDAFSYFDRHPGRFRLVHVKDMSASGEMVDVGQGTLDFRRIFARAAQAGIAHAFVEHDQPADPIESARRSFAALRAVLPQER